jgi:hypothetical protein
LGEFSNFYLCIVMKKIFKKQMLLLNACSLNPVCLFHSSHPSIQTFPLLFISQVRFYPKTVTVRCSLSFDIFFTAIFGFLSFFFLAYATFIFARLVILVREIGCSTYRSGWLIKIQCCRFSSVFVRIRFHWIVLDSMLFMKNMYKKYTF